MKVVFFPNAGMFASNFNFIKDGMSEFDIEIYEYAHHGSRILEPEYSDFKSMIEQISDDLFSRYGDRSIGICGYCMGSYVAYETTILLRTKYGKEAEFLIVSGSVPPEEFDKRDRIFSTEQDFFDYMVSVDGITKEIQSNERLLKIFLPIIKSDAERLHKILPTQLNTENILNTPIGVIYGEDDKEIKESTIQNWRKETKNFLGVDKLKGNHFFIFENQEDAIKSIRKYIQKAMDLDK